MNGCFPPPSLTQSLYRPKLGSCAGLNRSPNSDEMRIAAVGERWFGTLLFSALHIHLQAKDPDGIITYMLGFHWFATSSRYCGCEWKWMSLKLSVRPRES